MIACVSTSVAAAALVFALLAFTIATGLVTRRRPPGPDAGRPVQPTSPMWPRHQPGALSPRRTPSRPPATTRLVPVPSIGVNVLSDDAPDDLGPYVGGPPVASVRSGLIERPDW